MLNIKRLNTFFLNLEKRQRSSHSQFPVNDYLEVYANAIKHKGQKVIEIEKEKKYSTFIFR